MKKYYKSFCLPLFFTLSLVCLFSKVGYTQNIALGKTATANSTQNGNIASNAIDNNTSTYWQSGASFSANIYVDFLASYNFSQVSITWDGTNNYSQKVYIECSNNASTWVRVDSVMNASFDANNVVVPSSNVKPTSPNVINITNPLAKGRYLRLICQGRASSSHNIAEIDVRGTLTILPVELSRFNAISQNGGKVDISWATASETNNDYFTIDKSSDGKDFTRLAKIYSLGSGGYDYFSVDKNPFAGNNYYRLKQVDKDGTEKELGIKVVNVMLKNSGLSIYPNPVKGKSFTLNLPENSEEIINLEVLTLAGNRIFKQKYKKDSNNLKVNLDQNINEGIYLLRVNNQATIKLVVDKE
ncbi:MAG: discoidin domain-containing protein [Pedobacter sp.]|uniref:discoidin domain-containing protein n=1 Tax=Pedobacter sp. TaxID=1411316 RepID=UPI00280967FD|nr:discoidin domain-containing protein [Pedobacter sp.]MDQ8004762.1 discoidin domain-containing protein [Pedobacter sp.]